MAVTDKGFAAANARSRKMRCEPRPTPWRSGTTGTATASWLSSAQGSRSPFPRTTRRGWRRPSPRTWPRSRSIRPASVSTSPSSTADLYLPALLEGLLGSKAWAASRMGQAGGKARTPAKQAASPAPTAGLADGLQKVA